MPDIMLPSDLLLPPDAAYSLMALARQLRTGWVDQGRLKTVLDCLGAIAPEHYLEAGRQINSIGQLYPVHRRRLLMLAIRDWLAEDRSEHDLLIKTPGLEYLYIFHSDGYLRETALNKIDQPPATAFYFNCISYRLNDWVEQVREAAHLCAQRVFPKTSPDIVAAGAFVLLKHVQHWERGRGDLAILYENFERPEVIEQLALTLRRASSGKVGPVLQALLPRRHMDAYLPHLAAEAAQPALRALVLKMLIDRRARWPTGFETKWIDRSYGLARRVRMFGERPLEGCPPVDDLIKRGAKDKSALVRKIAADGLVANRAIVANMDDLLSLFLNDRNAAVRERALFISQDRDIPKPV